MPSIEVQPQCHKNKVKAWCCLKNSPCYNKQLHVTKGRRANQNKLTENRLVKLKEKRYQQQHTSKAQDIIKPSTHIYMSIIRDRKEHNNYQKLLSFRDFAHLKFTNIVTVSKATLGKLLRDGVERIWAFPSAQILN